MARAGVLYRTDTMEIDGAVVVSLDSDLDHYPEHPETHGLIEVPPDHPAIHDQEMWRVTEDGKLVRRDV